MAVINRWPPGVGDRDLLKCISNYKEEELKESLTILVC